jgi:hypothetical protein
MAQVHRYDLSRHATLQACRVTLSVVALLMGLAGCQRSSADRPGPPAPGPTQSAPTPSLSPSTTADAQATAKAAVLASYRAYWADVVAASHTADWQSARLDDHARGQPVQAVRNHLLLLKQEGLVARGDMRLAPRVVSLTASTAKVEDCQDITGFLNRDAKTGALRDRPSGKRFLARATLTRIDGRWLVTQAAQAIAVCGKA